MRVKEENRLFGEGILIVEDTKKDKDLCVLWVCEGVDTLNKGQAKGKVVMATGSEERKALCQLRE